MKLYATITSERATKGQGGNKYIFIDLLNEKKGKISEIQLLPNSLIIRHYSSDIFLDCADLSTAKRQKGEKLHIDDATGAILKHCPRCGRE